MWHALTVGRTVWNLMGERRLGMLAAGVGFFAMLAIFPAMAALIGLIALLADPAMVEESLAMASDFLPEDAFALIEEQTEELLGSADRTLGLTSVISLLAAVWAARLGVDALIQGVNAIYGGDPRNGIWGLLMALTLTAILIAVGATAMFAMLIAPITLALLTPFIPVGSWFPLIVELLRWVISIAVLVVGLSVFYRYAPNRPETRRSPFLSPGLLLALILWAAASVGFTLYLSHFGDYNEIYGSIGAVIVLMLWLYISAYAVLLGAALNFALEERAEPMTGPDQ